MGRMTVRYMTVLYGMDQDVDFPNHVLQLKILKGSRKYLLEYRDCKVYYISHCPNVPNVSLFNTVLSNCT